MAYLRSLSVSRTAFIFCAVALLNTIIPVLAANPEETIQGLDSNGKTRTLLIDRDPALYTKDFGDCLGGQSLINLTAFDAAYYADNMTVLFNLEGTTSLRNESLMIVISVEAYGEDRFDMTFNPCRANFKSLCPMNASVPITGGATIPVSPSDVAGIPSIALAIPDFEGSAVLRLFSNATQTEIGCFKAVMTNGNSLSHPTAISSVLGIFTAVALISSFATAIYGVSVLHIRTHYAHSLSVLVIFEVFQSIFFSGALSLNWPSVCAAFWSNFAWSAGMIRFDPLQEAINGLVGISGNSSQVGGAGSTILNNNGGLRQQIYGRALVPRAIANKTSDRLYSWAGLPVAPGLITPGNWTGFAGELSMLGIPAKSAFITGLVWFAIVVALLIAMAATFKWGLEGLSSIKWIKQDRFAVFRSHWTGFLTLIVLRSMLIAFFMVMTLTLYQFSSGGRAAPIAIAVAIFALFFMGMLGVAFYACFYRLKYGKYQSSPDRVYFQRRSVMKFIPWFSTVRESNLDATARAKMTGSLAFFKVDFVDPDSERQNVHQDQQYIKRFGWLTARFRRTRWWFFAVWIVYQFVRACFIGGAQANPTAQVLGILIWELIAFIVIILINPFEGSRNTALAVYMLGFSKVATAGLSIGFLPQFNVARIPTTVIGIIIIVIQGFLVVGLLILIVISAISSYMSLMRNREDFSPRRLENIRMKYFAHIEEKATDVPPAPAPPPEEPKQPYFTVSTVRRAPKIEDEDVDFVPDMPGEINNPAASTLSLHNRNIRSNSMRSQYSGFGSAPYGARVHRMSWSSREFQTWQEDEASRSGSPFGTPSRRTSGHMTGNNSISMTPLVRPIGSHGSLRPATPTKEQQRQFSNQRVAHAQ